MNRAFTLIELLVVVLIIGILASIALPLYQRAVFKSRAAEAFTNLKALKDALEVCELQNGRASQDNDTCMSFDYLDVQIGTKIGEGQRRTDNFVYQTDRGAWSSTDEIAVNALMRHDIDVCICLYDDGRFVTPSKDATAHCGTYPNFDVAELLEIEEDNNCGGCC